MNSRRHLKFSVLSEAVADAQQLAGVDYRQLGNWNLTQILDHLNKSMLASIEGREQSVLPRFVRPFAKWYVFGKMKRRDMVRVSVPAPQSVVPDDQRELPDVLAEFASLCDRVESPATSFIASHPYFGRFSGDEWRTMHRRHSGHHLGFLTPTDAG